MVDDSVSCYRTGNLKSHEPEDKTAHQKYTPDDASPITQHPHIFLPGLPWKNKESKPGQAKEREAKRERSILWERKRPQPIAADEDPEIVPSLARSSNPNKDIAILGLDVII